MALMGQAPGQEEERALALQAQPSTMANRRRRRKQGTTKMGLGGERG
ncbi:hypothetical protein COLO4_21644 [Corchorus olitorius]|uniref:Uncharacterized protein n=1 Tax=Corchorus olitorius TaxID=93759 RepID=A0A1R3IS51_9ROSI|nr:hypothetical protein COLO4_21644 [Corchorus olitorius]